MAATDPATREKVRALVREVLKSVPPEPEPSVTEHVIVNSLKAQALGGRLRLGVSWQTHPDPIPSQLEP